MNVTVGSENPVKLEAVRLAFLKVWPNEEWEVVGTKVSSGVPDQPMSDEESARGARTRARQAIEKTGADYGVGLEGGIQKIGEDYFDCGWIVVVDKEGREGVGSTFKVVVPPKVMRHIHDGMELGYATDAVFKLKDSKRAEGFFGAMTNNLITRAHGYRDGVISALSRFVQPELF